VFVADYGSHCVRVLSPDLSLHSTVGGGVGEVRCPAGVCADAAVVVVSLSGFASHCIAVFDRATAAPLRRFARMGSSNGRLWHPQDLCFTAHGHVAVCDLMPVNGRVSVFTVDGDFIDHVGVGVLKEPGGLACTASGDLVVVDRGDRCVRVFSGGEEEEEGGQLLATVAPLDDDDDDGECTGVAVDGSDDSTGVWLQYRRGDGCVLRLLQ
jgi:DNA-binding beta-propeller fold protein YncE